MNFKVKHFHSPLLLAIFLLFMGCCGHTYVGGIAYYPSGSRYNDSQYSLSITINGALCRAYVAHTKKTIFLELQKTDGTKVLERKYSVEGGNIEWSRRWEKENELTVVFYEYDGKYITSSEGHLIPDIRHIFSISINGNSTKEDYTPGKVPDWLIAQIVNIDNLRKQSTKP